MRLRFKGVEQRGEFVDDNLVGCRVGGNGEDQSEIENVFVAVVRGGGEADGVAEDAVLGGAEGDGAGAEVLTGDDVGGVAGEVEQGGLGGVG